MELCKSLDLPTPESHVVDDPKNALDLIKQSKFPMILKATAVLDDLGRNDMTNYPLAGDSAPDYPKTLARLQTGLSVPMTKKTPYILQQFVLGSEWCTHATVKQGKLVAFVCCPSNDMLYVVSFCTSTLLNAMTVCDTKITPIQKWDEKQKPGQSSSSQNGQRANEGKRRLCKVISQWFACSPITIRNLTSRRTLSFPTLAISSLSNATRAYTPPSACYVVTQLSHTPTYRQQ